ncbi:type II secretion system F family protein [Oryzibacter oryziterrae]|uniref:type II secretion system F family protein n=1 Tax=Oryzibacter oryziterrae TaxID=2766474 RepID=UPI001F2AF248|nr:type II secretion system F family protein [Oryzibacter oryziterrae]
MTRHFAYKALGPTGKLLAGGMEAASRADVLNHLEKLGYTPVSVEEAAPKAPPRGWREMLTPEPKSEDITGFTIDLAMLLKGGVVLDEALAILTQMESRRWLKRLIAELHVELSGGKSLSQVLALHPKLFPPLYIKMIEVAETSGRLEEALADIARERQRVENLRKKFFSAISYPLFLAVAATGVLCFVLLYVIPQFEGAITGFRDKLDPSALRVFELSRIFRENVDLFGAGAIGLLVLFIIIGRLGRGGSFWVSLLARLPLSGTVMTYDLTLTFCRTLAVLAKNGVDISTALRLIKGVIRIPSAAAELDHVISDVRQGRRLSEALAKRILLPGHVVQMLRVGEEAGKLADSAERIGGFYEAKLETALGRITAIIGPAMMIGVSLMVAWLIVSVMTALISINDLLV